MDNLRPGVTRRPSPQLPAFCRTRRPITTTVRVTTLQQLLWLLWLVLALQLSTLLLILAGPVPAPVQPVAMALVLPPRGQITAAQLAASAAMRPGAIALRQSAQIPSVLSPSQP
jgi:hypothetical protein